MICSRCFFFKTGLAELYNPFNTRSRRESDLVEERYFSYVKHPRLVRSYFYSYSGKNVHIKETYDKSQIVHETILNETIEYEG